MTRTEILARRANAVARIDAIQNGAPVTGNWNNPQHCINANQSMVRRCDEQLAQLDKEA